MSGFGRFSGIFRHHVMLHQRLRSKERKTAGAAQNATDRVLCGFLQPMADGVFELLEPDYWTYSER